MAFSRRPAVHSSLPVPFPTALGLQALRLCRVHLAPFHQPLEGAVKLAFCVGLIAPDLFQLLIGKEQLRIECVTGNFGFGRMVKLTTNHCMDPVALIPTRAGSGSVEHNSRAWWP